MKTTEEKIRIALLDGNYVRALFLSGYSIVQHYYRKNNRQECDLIIRSKNGFEGKFASACDAWNSIKG